jgi:hypothetical protein
MSETDKYKAALYAIAFVPFYGLEPESDGIIAFAREELGLPERPHTKYEQADTICESLRVRRNLHMSCTK